METKRGRGRPRTGNANTTVMIGITKDELTKIKEAHYAYEEKWGRISQSKFLRIQLKGILGEQ